MLDSNSKFPKIGLKCEIWDALTGKDLLTAHLDYYSSFIFSKFIESLNLPTSAASSAIDCPDDLDTLALDEELTRALDHHSIITSQLPDDHIQTADEIIEEIDRLMVGEAVELDLELCDPQANAEFRTTYVWKPVSVLEQMSIAQLNALVDELDVCVRHYSACLVQELAFREELEYEQEVKDIFFTRLHEVQNRMDEWATYNVLAVAGNSGDNVVHEGVDYNKYGDDANRLEERRRGMFGGASSAATAKAILANAAFAVRRRWRRMGRSLEKARSTWHHRGRRRRHLTGDSSDGEDRYYCRLRGCTQPIDPRDISVETTRGGEGGKMCVSNSNLELAPDGGVGAEDEDDEEEWSVRSETNSTANTPTTGTVTNSTSSVGHSPRHHQIWFTSTTSAARGKRNPQEDLKFLSTKIPYHRSLSYGGACNGPTVGHLELFNEFLFCMLTNNPNLTPLLTDYILNVYAPSEKSMLPKLVI